MTTFVIKGERMTHLNDIEAFLSSKKFTFVGLSTEEKHFSRMVLSEFVKRDFDVVGVNPKAKEIDGVRCYNSVNELDDNSENIFLMLPPPVKHELITNITKNNVKRIWSYGMNGKSTLTEQSKKYLEEKEIKLIDGYCPLMFVSNSGFIHSVHGSLLKLFGRYPK